MCSIKYNNRLLIIIKSSIYNRSDVGKFIQGWNTYIYDNNVTSEEEAIESLKEEQLKCLQGQIDVLNSTIRKINLL